MDFKKKLRSRLNIIIGYMIVGVILIILFLTKLSENQYLMPFGISLVAVGILKIIQYKRITKNDETIRNRKIAETDERNIAIIHKAKSMAFGIYILISCVLVVAFEIMEKTEYAHIMELNVCGFVVLYWICYFIYNKKS